MERATLSVVASRVQYAIDQHAMAMEYDAGFDGGEWSTGWHVRQMTSDARDAVHKSGWTVEEFEKALAERTTAKFAHFSGLVDVLYDGLEQLDDEAMYA